MMMSRPHVTTSSANDSDSAHLCAQKQVARTEQEILNRIKEREIHVTQLKRKLDGVKVRHLSFSILYVIQNNDGCIDPSLPVSLQTYADGERGEVEQLLDQVSSSLDRIRSQVVGGIENQLDAVMSKGEGLVSRLEAELSLLADRRATLELQAISQDHIGFLQVREFDRHLVRMTVSLETVC